MWLNTICLYHTFSKGACSKACEFKTSNSSAFILLENHNIEDIHRLDDLATN